MLQAVCILVSLFASTLGAICGIGGGVIMKPILDATGVVSVQQASVLSCCTVLAMSAVSLYRRTKSGGLARQIDLRRTLPLAVGAVIGGFVGNSLFQQVALLTGDSMAGVMQNALLMLLTLMNIPYLLLEHRIHRFSVRFLPGCLLAGVFLGTMSSFLGIGGGPINLLFLSLLFSMGIKEAGLNSIFIIFLSQATSLLKTALRGGLAEVDLMMLLLMVLGGILGGMLGSHLNKRFTEKRVSQLLLMLLCIITAICAYNICRLM